MDGRYRQVGVPFKPALTLLTTVISTPQEGVAITDAGVKSLTVEFGWPEVVGMPNAKVAYLSEEHTKLTLTGEAQLKPGDRIELLPTHGCTTFNLHDLFYVVRGGIVEDIWPVAARGRSQ
jgi:D-serine deaminase-like pyridoxal phosphate-dependent protein